MKKLLNIIFVLIIIFTFSGCKNNTNEKMIVTTNFPSYDLARAITKNSDWNVKMLLKPGSEMHDYEPSPQDIIDIEKSKIFIYTGGDSDEWIKNLLGNLNLKETKVIKLMDLVDLQNEEIVAGMDIEEDEEEMDEHVWTNPLNDIVLLNNIKDEIIKLDFDNKLLYEENTNNYINKLNKIDNEIKEIVNNAKRKIIVFGDRFPLLYFAKQYGLTYYAAFPGCSHATEASSKTLSFLINKIKSEKIPVIFHIELSNNRIATMISEETGAKIKEFHTAHNILQKDFDDGITIIDLFERNIKVLKEALN